MMTLKFKVGDKVVCTLKEGEKDVYDGQRVWGQTGIIKGIDSSKTQPYLVYFRKGYWWILESSIALIRQIPKEEEICAKIKELIAKQAKIKAAKEKLCLSSSGMKAAPRVGRGITSGGTVTDRRGVSAALTERSLQEAIESLESRRAAWTPADTARLQSWAQAITATSMELHF
jgi:hypothetical protein